MSIKLSKLSYFPFTLKLNEKKKVPLKEYGLGKKFAGEWV